MSMCVMLWYPVMKLVLPFVFKAAALSVLCTKRWAAVNYPFGLLLNNRLVAIDR